MGALLCSSEIDVTWTEPSTAEIRGPIQRDPGHLPAANGAPPLLRSGAQWSEGDKTSLDHFCCRLRSLLPDLDLGFVTFRSLLLLRDRDEAYACRSTSSFQGQPIWKAVSRVTRTHRALSSKQNSSLKVKAIIELGNIQSLVVSLKHGKLIYSWFKNISTTATIAFNASGSRPSSLVKSSRTASRVPSMTHRVYLWLGRPSVKLLSSVYIQQLAPY